MAVSIRRMNLKSTLACLVAGAAALIANASATAGVMTTVVLGSSGWQASWDSSLDPVLDINVDGVTANAVYIEKIAQFTQGPINGVFPSIDITFTQIDPNAVANIVISDEVITNTTGSLWTDFHMDILGASNVAFNPAASAGFSISPFTQSSFTNSNQTFNAFGGVVPNNSFWFPGQISGELWISVNLTPTAPTSFVLSERPTPAPGVLALLGLGGLLGTSRRRRNG